MTRNRTMILASVAVLATAGLGTGVALAAVGSARQPAALSPAPAASPGWSAAPGYGWYRSMMSGRYRGGMMGGPPGGWVASPAGYRWMTGGAAAPGWMRGSTPSAVMRGSDPGTIMGTLFAGAPGPRVSSAQARRLGRQAPAGASINRATRTITFTTPAVHLTVLASPSMPAESFRIAGLTDPAVSVPAGARVAIELINADEDMAHGLVIAAAGAASSPIPMMTTAPAFPGAAVWFLGKPTTAGMHAATLTFTAGSPGRYQYLCPVPDHAREGMAGTFTVR